MVKNSQLTAHLQELIAPVVAENELFLEDLSFSGTGKYRTLRIVVDLPTGVGGVSADQLDQLTRAVSDVLDQADPIQSEYQLEVSTPGAERELKTPRHYQRATGHLVQFQLLNAEKFTARIQQVNEATVQVIPEKKVPKSEKVIHEPLRELNFEEVKKARVLVELKKPASQSTEGE